MAAVYALLVGINNYPIKPLQGCINDVNAVEEYLKTRYKGEEIFIKRLTDEDEIPTRENFIKSFEFFKNASADDFCLFYYSGHGSFSVAPQEFWTETDGYNESFVCMDSRNEGGRDLMDKEMSFLLWKHFKSKPDVSLVVITDCCHSGTITKAFIDNSEVTDRMMTTSNTYPETIKEYYGFGEVVDGEEGYVLSEDGTRVTVKRANHIHLAASLDNQTAKELVIDGKRRGAFTYSLLKTLYTSGGMVSYKELVNNASLLVKTLVQDQTPSINVNGELNESEKHNIFLSRANAAFDPKYDVYNDPKLGWCIKAVALQGVAKGDEVIIDGVCTTVISEPPFADFAPLVSKPQLASQKFHRATVNRKQNLFITASLGADLEERVKNILQKCLEDRSSDVVHISEPGKYVIRSHANYGQITLPGSDKPIFRPLPITTAEEGVYFLERMEIVGKWDFLLALTNASSKLNSQHFKIRLYRSTEAGNYNKDSFEEVVNFDQLTDFNYEQSGGNWSEPAFRLSVTNLSNVPLWLCCAYMQFDFGVLGSFFSSVQVGVGKTAWLTTKEGGVEDDVILLHVDPRYQDLGYNQITEYLKVFVSSSKIEADNLSQNGVEMPLNRGLEVKNGYKEKSVIDKSPGVRPKNIVNSNDWTTVTIGLRITKPKSTLDIIPGRQLEIQSIRIEPHNSLQASVSLGSSSEASRSVGQTPSPAQAKMNSYLASFDLGASTKGGQVMDMLELYDVKAVETVTPDNPLVIVPASTRSVTEENVIPIGYDPALNLYYPLGYTSADGKIIINVLPEQTAPEGPVTEKSFIGSIKIYFQKVIGQKLGFRYEYPQLSIGKLAEDGKIIYEKDKQVIVDRVAKAENILLFIHGIIGDTEGMVKSIKTKLEDGSTIEESYDLILTFDYENLNTQIEVTAGLLKERLAAVGLNQGHEKQLTLIAHSMGGLVSRWFIEKLDGSKVVDRLIMLGTPNNGTPWSDVRDMAEVLLTYALNGAALLKPWMFVLSGLGKVVGGMQISLKQMDVKTGIYDVLNDGTDPEIPYIILAGNTKSIIADYEKTQSLIQKLFTRMKKKGVYELLDLLLFRRSNDIAVAVESIKSIKRAENWEIKPVVYEVACDHLNYFTLKQALEKARVHTSQPNALIKEV